MKLRFFAKFFVKIWYLRLWPKKSDSKVELRYFTLKTVTLIRKIKLSINLRIIKAQMASQFIQRKQFIISWKKYIQEIDLYMLVKMFDNLKPKIVKAKNNRLESLL